MKPLCHAVIHYAGHALYDNIEALPAFRRQTDPVEEIRLPEIQASRH
jgi:hypothetical protein